MIWRNVIKGLFLASLTTLIIPGVLIWQIIKRFGISETSLLGIMAVAQIYIIWAQLEIALRQSELSAVKYEPIFKLGKRYIGVGNWFYYIENVGEYLARNVNVSVQIIEGNGKVKESISQQFGDVASSERRNLGNLRKWEEKYVITIDIDYEDIFNRVREAHFIKEPKFSGFLNIMSNHKLSGILLNSLEEIGLIFRGIYLIYSRKIPKPRSKV